MKSVLTEDEVGHKALLHFLLGNLALILFSFGQNFSVYAPNLEVWKLPENIKSSRYKTFKKLLKPIPPSAGIYIINLCFRARHRAFLWLLSRVSIAYWFIDCLPISECGVCVLVARLSSCSLCICILVQATLPLRNQSLTKTRISIYIIYLFETFASVYKLELITWRVLYIQERILYL